MSAAGLELLFSGVQRDLRAAGDCVVCGIHWVLITNGFKCLGKGEQSTGRTERQSELLPPGWNECQDLYILRYRKDDGETFVLKAVKADSAMLVHFMRSGDEKVASVNISISDYSTDDWSSFDSAFRNLSQLERTIKEQIVGEFASQDVPGTSQPHSDQRRSHQERSRHGDDPLRVPPRHSQRPPPPDWADPGDPFSIGRGDLDPLRGGGGMLMDPFRGRGRLPGFDPSSGMPGRLPRGAVPPGARFDPFGPPGGPPGSRPGPDHDHARPPTWDDDMFM